MEEHRVAEDTERDRKFREMQEQLATVKADADKLNMSLLDNWALKQAQVSLSERMDSHEKLMEASTIAHSDFQLDLNDMFDKIVA